MATSRRRRYYRAATRTYRRSYKGVSFGASPTMLIGIAAGALLPVQDARVEAGIDAVACMPIQGRTVSPIKMGAQGFRFGRIVRLFVPQLGGIASGITGTGNSGNSPWL